ncbi:MAG: hypothetical protein Q7R81_05280 [Candidatus Peregrinibacteria bacterium]|nr:hypothetical protein [Candidatus Peregrinibacteria bacterium]
MLLPRKAALETAKTGDAIRMPYISHPNDPRMIETRIKLSDLRKVEIMMNVAARYEVPERINPSKTKYVATVLMTRKRISQILFVEKMFTPNRTAPIIDMSAPVKALRSRN